MPDGATCTFQRRLIFLTQIFMSNTSSDLSSRVASVLPVSQGQFWGGTWHARANAQTMPSINPSTGEVLAQVQLATAEDVDAAVGSARMAYPAWASTAPLERARCLREAASRVRANAADLALLDAADCGNPVKAMLLDAEIAATQLEYFAGLVLEIKGETIPTANGSLNYTRREPLGVVARIFPFNHPFMFAAGKIAAPLGKEASRSRGMGTGLVGRSQAECWLDGRSPFRHQSWRARKTHGITAAFVFWPGPANGLFFNICGYYPKYFIRNSRPYKKACHAGARTRRETAAFGRRSNRATLYSRLDRCNLRWGNRAIGENTS